MFLIILFNKDMLKLKVNTFIIILKDFYFKINGCLSGVMTAKNSGINELIAYINRIIGIIENCEK